MGADQGLTKPNPALFLKACEYLGVNPENTLMVGDAQGDISMAREAGAAGAIAICWDNSSGLDIQNADEIITQLDQLSVVED